MGCFMGHQSRAYSFKSVKDGTPECYCVKPPNSLDMVVAKDPGLEKGKKCELDDVEFFGWCVCWTTAIPCNFGQFCKGWPKKKGNTGEGKLLHTLHTHSKNDIQSIVYFMYKV